MNVYVADLAIQHRHPDHNAVLLTFVNFQYVEVALNWILYMNKLGITNYIIGALDDRAFEFFEFIEIPVFHAATVSMNHLGHWDRMEAIWRRRMEAISSIAYK